MKIPKRLVVAAAATATTLCANATPTLTTLHSFQGSPVDGANPYGALTFLDGSLWGTTWRGGAFGQHGYGSVFAIDPATGAQTRIDSFDGSNGYRPYDGLVALNGRLYGEAFGGGWTGCAEGCGVVFSAAPQSGTASLLHGFVRNDGKNPSGKGLTAHRGYLYGSTTLGGALGHGVIFRMDPVSGAEQVLYDFAQGGGIQPTGELLYLNGALYGTTMFGGEFGWGTVFKLDLHTQVLTTVYSFHGQPDGYDPMSGVIYFKGALYGTTPSGGSANSGTVNKIDLTTQTETVLCSFAGGADGANPEDVPLIMNGKLYGSTLGGGKDSLGTLFVLDPGTGKESVLHQFGGPDGAKPSSALIYVNGAFYGTTQEGGDFDQGTAFKLTP